MSCARLPLGTAYVDDGDKCEDDGPRGDDGPNDDDVLRDIRGDGDNNEPKTLRMGNRVSVCLYIFFLNHLSTGQQSRFPLPCCSRNLRTAQAKAICWEHFDTSQQCAGTRKVCVGNTSTHGNTVLGIPQHVAKIAWDHLNTWQQWVVITSTFAKQLKLAECCGSRRFEDVRDDIFLVNTFDHSGYGARLALRAPRCT